MIEENRPSISVMLLNVFINFLGQLSVPSKLDRMLSRNLVKNRDLCRTASQKNEGLNRTVAEA